MRILFATEHIHHPQGGGGGERNTHELCLALKTAGQVPAVMSSLSPQNSWLSWSNRLRRKLHSRHQFPRDTGCGYAVYRGWGENGPAEVAARFHPDAVIIQSLAPQKLIGQFRALNIPAAVYFHEVDKIDHLRALAGMGVPVLSNSPFTAARLKERCGLQSRVLLPLIDPVFYKTATTRERVLFVNTVPRKGLDIALALAARRKDIPFDFVRSWILSEEQVQALEARARALGNVTIHAPVQDMRPLYRRARLLLVPSLWEETWGRVVTEAQMNGIPVLASDRGGLPQSVGPGGMLMAADAPIEQWDEALWRLWSDPSHYRALCAAALRHAARPEIQPRKLVADLLAFLDRQVRGSSASLATGDPDPLHNGSGGLVAIPPGQIR